MKVEIHIPYSYDIWEINEYYPSYITKDKNGLYGICSPLLGVEKSGLLSSKEIFEEIGIPKFDLCEYQEDQVLESLRESILLDLLNEAHDFGAQPWSVNAEKKFIEEIVPKRFSYIYENYQPYRDDLRKQLFEPNSKYMDAPFFYLAHSGHICLDAHCFNHDEDTPGMMWWWGVSDKLPAISKQLVEDDVLIVTKNTKPLFRMDKMYYFCILQVVNLNSHKVKYVDFNFSLLCHPKGSLRDINRERIDGKGDVALQIEQVRMELHAMSKWYMLDHLSIITNNHTQNAYIKLYNKVEKELHWYSNNIPDQTIYQFSYDYATSDEIRKVEEIITKKK